MANLKKGELIVILAVVLVFSAALSFFIANFNNNTKVHKTTTSTATGTNTGPGLNLNGVQSTVST